MIDISKIDTFENRMMWLGMTVEENVNGTMTPVKKISGICVNLQISCTLPLFTIPDETIARTSVFTSTTPADSRVDIFTNLPYDPEFEDSLDPVTGTPKGPRFRYITQFISGVTKALNLLVYDYKYNDILVIPDLDFLDNSDGLMLQDTTYIIKTFRIGSTALGALISMDAMLPPASNIVKLPIPKENIGNTVTINMLNGIANDTKTKNTRIIEKYPTGAEIMRGDAIPSSFINLGKASDLFEDPSVNVPFFIGYQVSPETYNISYIGNKSSKDRNLYIMLKF